MTSRLKCSRKCQRTRQIVDNLTAKQAHQLMNNAAYKRYIKQLKDKEAKNPESLTPAERDALNKSRQIEAKALQYKSNTQLAMESSERAVKNVQASFNAASSAAIGSVTAISNAVSTTAKKAQVLLRTVSRSVAPSDIKPGQMPATPKPASAKPVPSSPNSNHNVEHNIQNRKLQNFYHGFGLNDAQAKLAADYHQSKEKSGNNSLDTGAIARAATQANGNVENIAAALVKNQAIREMQQNQNNGQKFSPRMGG